MDPEQKLLEMLRNPPIGAARDAFFKQVSKEGHLTTRVAVRMWMNASPELSSKALAYLRSSGELAIVPLLEARICWNDPSAAVQALALLTDAELALRQRVAKRIDGFFDDKRLIPLEPVLAPVEERERPRRVCDEAYTGMRRLIHLGEDRVRQQVQADVFYSCSESQRDACIAAARSSHIWNGDVEPEEEEEEED